MNYISIKLFIFYFQRWGKKDKHIKGVTYRSRRFNMCIIAISKKTKNKITKLIQKSLIEENFMETKWLEKDLKVCIEKA